jgi:hypothetical protein
MYRVRILWAVAGLALLAYQGLLRADPPTAKKAETKKAEAKKSTPAKFLRIQRNDKGEPIALETAIVRFVPASGEGEITVDLIGAVHVGDGDYYRTLNRKMTQYDVLLYELVAPEGTRIPKGGKRDNENAIAWVHKIMKFVLDLESQTEKIDYTRKNFVHADLSPKQMAEAIKERGDDGVTIALGVAADFLRQQNLQAQKKEKETAKKGAGKDAPKKDEDADDFDLTSILDPDGALKLKRVMAEQFEQAEDGLGPTLNKILIADRNKACLKVLTKEIANGKKKIGIFYGAAHMPDFEKRLREEFGLKRQNEEWITAWDLEFKERDILIDLIKLLGKELK